VSSLGQVAPEDLTARARIRDAALRLFADRGIGPATIRDIAAAAGVSSGLVRHHFGSKEALRDACDTYAVDQIGRYREQMLTEGRMADVGFMTAIHPTIIVLQNYLVRSMMDGSATGMAMFESVVEQAERYLTDLKIETTDLRAYAAVLCAMQMGVFLMHDQLSTVLGVDTRTVEGHARMNRGFVDAFTHQLLTPAQAAMMHAAADRVNPPPSPKRRAKRRTAKE